MLLGRVLTRAIVRAKRYAVDLRPTSHLSSELSVALELFSLELVRLATLFCGSVTWAMVYAVEL
jgi:hypothetical protein